MTAPSPINVDQVFTELGRCLVAYQSIEHLLKILLPHVSATEAEALAKAEAQVSWRELLDSRETLGGLMKLLSQRVSSTDPSRLVETLSALVNQRNEIVHHFVSQPFFQLKSTEQYHEAMRFLQTRRMAAAAFLQPLQLLALEFSEELGDTNANH